MNRKQLILIIVAIIVVAGVVILVLLSKKPGGLLPGVSQLGGVPTSPGEAPPPPGIEFYEPEIPNNAAVTPPKNEAPASSNPNLDTKIRFYDMKATKNGFEPSILTVKSGDNIRIDLMAVDGNYDFDIPYLGAYFPTVKKGTKRPLAFDTSLTGTFIFQCRDYCPNGKIIKGQLIVLP